MIYQLWEIVSSKKPQLDSSDALWSSIVYAAAMFWVIQRYFHKMDPKFYTNGDIVAAFRCLDLRRYLSLSDETSIWWNEIEPVLDFFFWLKDIEGSVSGCSPIKLCFCHD